MMLAPTKKQRRKVCKCERCTLARKFERLALKLPEKDRVWMLQFFGVHMEMTEQLEMCRQYIGN